MSGARVTTDEDAALGRLYRGIDTAPTGDHVLSVNGLPDRHESPIFPATIREGETTEMELKIAD